MNLPQNTSYGPKAAPPAPFKGLPKPPGQKPAPPAQQPPAPMPKVAMPPVPAKTEFQPPAAPVKPFDASAVGISSTAPGAPTAGEASHPGVDIANAQGTPVPAFQGGIVTGVTSGQQRGSPGTGNRVEITDAFGQKHYYSHLNRAWVRIGQQVGQGQQIGAMGNSGQTYSPSGRGDGTHLDYRVKDVYQRYVDPKKFVKTAQPKQQ